MITVTPEIVKKLSSYASKNVTEALVNFLPKAAQDYQINTPIRLAHFLAQCAQESDSFKVLEEYASGAAYEGRKDLGNIYPGDGKRYKGRGIIQLTGRANYRRVGQALGLDLEGNPALAETQEVAVLTACQFWKDNNINALADEDSLAAVKKITKVVNGGYTHLKERQNFYTKFRNITPIMFESVYDKKLVQIKLNEKIGHLLEKPLVIDGLWGRFTLEALEKFQPGYITNGGMTPEIYKRLIS